MTRTGSLLLVALLIASQSTRAGDPPVVAEPATSQPAVRTTSAPAGAATAKGRRGKDAGAKDAGAKEASGPARDRLELDASAVTGSRELPKVLVIVPWKRADLGDLVGKPLNSLVDEALQPLDREVFRREVDYHATLAPDRPASPPAATGR
jgi:hypothetical protein